MDENLESQQRHETRKQRPRPKPKRPTTLSAVTVSQVISSTVNVASAPDARGLVTMSAEHGATYLVEDGALAGVLLSPEAYATLVDGR